MTEELKVRLVRLADIYESPSFLTDDPAQFMHRYGDIRDAELAAFIAANLAFGRRTLILQHVELILAAAGDSLAEWIAGGGYERLFPQSAIRSTGYSVSVPCGSSVTACGTSCARAQR